ncbi:RNase P modulator RnpM [Mitsuokella sp. oral taxon 131]|uniref:RNase P modulator RnpM n=1 Tax=Mitsuokella sp. oral taxon 131 TaxID=1321780 RepID=UPI0003ADAEF5|nr:YlxR family protein [Mitsuokella sp. oral taxon 131]ERL25127.1 hypothetical protein HMPREF1985_00461 [Mitsuokella sp. oral taxon 131 str. W9106]
MKAKRIPERFCLGCQESRPKKDLLRIVRSPEGEFSVDVTGKKAGRGAYICRSMACLERARKSRALERSFKSPIAPVVYDMLANELKGLEG